MARSCGRALPNSAYETRVTSAETVRQLRGPFRYALIVVAVHLVDKHRARRPDHMVQLSPVHARSRRPDRMIQLRSLGESTPANTLTWRM